MDRTVQLITDMWNKLQNECHNVVTEENYDALKKAITALEQQPDAIHNEREQAYMKGYEDASKRFRTEPCEDAISRQAVLDYLMDNMTWYSEDGYETDEDEKRESITSLINAVPSVTPQQKVGRWIEKYREKFKYYCYKCGAGSDLRTNFCPCCGAKMVEPQESEE